MLGVSFVRQPDDAGTSDRLLRRAVTLAHRTPILAEPLAAEQLALDGRRIWIGNPLDAFTKADQLLYLDWLTGKPAGDAILRAPIDVVLVQPGSPRSAGLPAGPPSVSSDATRTECSTCAAAESRRQRRGHWPPRRARAARASPRGRHERRRNTQALRDLSRENTLAQGSPPIRYVQSKHVAYDEANA
jgi:hypothetical protein